MGMRREMMGPPARQFWQMPFLLKLRELQLPQGGFFTIRNASPLKVHLPEGLFESTTNIHPGQPRATFSGGWTELDVVHGKSLFTRFAFENMRDLGHLGWDENLVAVWANDTFVVTAIVAESVGGQIATFTIRANLSSFLVFIREHTPSFLLILNLQH